MSVEENMTELVESYSSEFRLQKERVRHIIGAAHWPTDGRFKEELLRRFIRGFVSQSLDVSTGFIRAEGPPRRLSSEIDILIADRSLSPPFLNEPWLLIAPPPSIRAHIQLKSAYSAENLRESYRGFVSASKAIGPSGTRRQVWGGIVFCEPTERRLPDLVDAIGTVLQPLIKELFQGSRVITLDVQIPNALYFLGEAVVFLEVTSDSGAHPEIQMSAFHCGDLASGVLIANLTEHLLDSQRGFQATATALPRLDRTTFEQFEQKLSF